MAVDSANNVTSIDAQKYAARYEQGQHLDGRINQLVRQHTEGTEETLEAALAQYLEAAKSGSLRDERNAWDKLALVRRGWQEEMQDASRLAYDVVTERRP